MKFVHTSLCHISFHFAYSFFIRYFPHLHFQCYPKGPPYPPPPPIPYPPTPPFWPWRSPVLGHIKFACQMGLSFQWWPTRPSFDTYAAKDKSSGVLVSSYCCSTYRVAVPFSSLGNFSSSSIRGRVTHPIADCDHPLLCLLGPGIIFKCFILTIFIRYFLHLQFKCYPKSSPYPPSHSPFFALAFPCTGAYKVCKSNGPLFAVMAD